MRTLTAGMATHLAGDTHTLCTMLRLDLRDGTVLAFTDHDSDLSFDLGDGAATYQPWTGIEASAVTLAIGFDVSNFEVTGPITELVSRNDVLGGRMRGARARLFMVNWNSLNDGAIPIMKGHVAEARVDGSRFVLEVRGLQAAFNEIWGRVLSPLCSATFGDSSTGCPVVRTPVAATVTAVTDDFRFTTNLGGGYADKYFSLGGVQFLTGGLANTAEARVIGYTGATGDVEVLEPLVDAPEIGDMLNLFRGCSLLLKSDDATLPTCLTYGAVEDFRGFPEVPGSRFYNRVSAPGAAYA